MMDNRQRRARRRHIAKHRSRKRLLILLLLVVIGVGACSLQQIFKASPTAAEPQTERPEMITENPVTEEATETAEETETTEATEPPATEPEDTEDTEGSTEDLLAPPRPEDFETKLQGYAEVVETLFITKEPGSGEEVKQVTTGDIVETYGSAGGFTKVSIREFGGFVPDRVVKNASVDDQLKVIDGILIANRQYYMPENFDPGIRTELMIQFERMKDDMDAEGMIIDIGSGYRTYDYQLGVIERNTERYGEEDTLRSVAPAGHSEHQTGLAIDIINDQPETNIANSFKDTEEGIWLAENSYRYGFILRYPEGKEDVTGYVYEPWHFRYVGEEMASRIFESGLTLEEFFGLDPHPMP